MSWNTLVPLFNHGNFLVPIVINATHIGRHLDGIGVYSMQLLKHLALAASPFTFLVYVNRAARVHFRDVRWPEHMRIRWVTASLSPDYQLPGHLSRLVFANYLGVKHRRQPLFTTSQLEASFTHPRQMVTVHDVIPLHFPAQHPRQYPYFKWVLPHVVRRALRVITPSRHTCRQVVRQYDLPPERVQVIYHGPGLYQRFPGPVAPLGRERFVLFLGRLAPSKNLKTLLAAFEQLNGRQHMPLLVAGKGCATSTLPNVCFTGYVSMARAQELYRRAALFVYPSLEEGFGFPPLEAMAHGCPVLASTGGSLQEVLGTAAMYTGVHCPEALAESLNFLMHCRELREQLSRAGNRRAARFCWQHSAREHLALFQLFWSQGATGTVPHGTEPAFTLKGLPEPSRDRLAWQSGTFPGGRP